MCPGLWDMARDLCSRAERDRTLYGPAVVITSASRRWWEAHALDPFEPGRLIPFNAIPKSIFSRERPTTLINGVLSNGHNYSQTISNWIFVWDFRNYIGPVHRLFWEPWRTFSRGHSKPWPHAFYIKRLFIGSVWTLILSRTFSCIIWYIFSVLCVVCSYKYTNSLIIS